MLTPENKQHKKLFLTLGIMVFLSLLFIVIKSTLFKNATTNEKSLHALFYEASKGITTDEKQREMFTNCLVEKFKTRYGNRFQDIDVNDPKNVNKADVEACTDQIIELSWTPSVEERMLKKFASMEELNGFSEKQKMDYARCLLSKLKVEYPNGLNAPVPTQKMDEFYMSCVPVLKTKSNAE